jgi:DNA-directed RNA polymerase specialized sigma24 family protein
MSSQPATAHDLLRASLEANADRLRGYIYTDLRGRHRAGFLDVPPDRDTTFSLLSEVAVVALTKAEAFDTTRDPLGWLIGIAQRVVQGHVRDAHADTRRARDPNGFSTVSTGDLAPDADGGNSFDADDLFGVLEGADPREATSARLDVERFLPLLAADQADVLRRHHMEGEPLANLAEEAGCTENAMKARLFRARRTMRKMMTDEKAVS